MRFLGGKWGKINVMADKGNGKRAVEGLGGKGIEADFRFTILDKTVSSFGRNDDSWWVEGERFAPSRECPHLKIEIWGTRFRGFNQIWATLPSAHSCHERTMRRV
jgi:hypothetical protein